MAGPLAAISQTTNSLFSSMRTLQMLGIDTTAITEKVMAPFKAMKADIADKQKENGDDIWQAMAQTAEEYKSGTLELDMTKIDQPDPATLELSTADFTAIYNAGAAQGIQMATQAQQEAVQEATSETTWNGKTIFNNETYNEIMEKASAEAIETLAKQDLSDATQQFNEQRTEELLNQAQQEGVLMDENTANDDYFTVMSQNSMG